MIAIVGVDGCGKTSLIRSIEQILAQRNLKVTVVRCPAKRRRRGPILNHAQKPWPPLVSMIKLLVRAAVWTLRYHLRFRPLVARGGVVLMDRFYFDDLQVDPLKYRYGGPTTFARWVRGRLPRPAGFLLLDAPEEVMYGRKQEVPRKELTRQREEFLRRYACLPETCAVLDASAPLDELTVQAVAAILIRARNVSADAALALID